MWSHLFTLDADGCLDPFAPKRVAPLHAPLNVPEAAPVVESKSARRKTLTIPNGLPAEPVKEALLISVILFASESNEKSADVAL